MSYNNETMNGGSNRNGDAPRDYHDQTQQQQLLQQLPSGIAAIAEQIHKRAVELANEQSSLQAAEEELAVLQSNFELEQKRSQATRSKYLSSMVQQHSTELECCKIQKQIWEREEETKKLKEQEREILQELEQQKEAWESSSIQGKLIQHSVRLELFQKYIQGSIEARQRKMQNRKEKLEKATQLHEQLEQDRQDVMLQQQQIQADMMRMTDLEDQANQEVEAVVQRVHASLEKRSGLRKSLREAQQSYQNTHDDAEKLAAEYDESRRV